jgi:prevent-host-death family protein
VFAASDIARRLYKVLAAASRWPVTITRRGSGSFVLLSLADYRQLAGARCARLSLVSEGLDEEEIFDFINWRRNLF